MSQPSEARPQETEDRTPRPTQGKEKKQKRIRAWCFTINASEKQGFGSKSVYDGWSLEHLRPVVDALFGGGSIKYCIMGREIGKQGRKHIQGYVVFKSGVTLNSAKRKLSCVWAHFEPARGTGEQNKSYCSKSLDDGDICAKLAEPVVEWGTCPVGKGVRTDLKALLSPLMSGEESLHEWIGSNPAYYVRYRRGIQDLYMHQLQKRIPMMRPVRVEIHYGPTGTGKTYHCVHRAPSYDEIYFLSQKGPKALWFDGYMGEAVLIIDEYTPNDISMANLLTITDTYKRQFPIKGGFIYGAWNLVLFTSNWHPDEWFTLQPNVEAFKRRIDLVKLHDKKYVAPAANENKTN